MARRKRVPRVVVEKPDSLVSEWDADAGTYTPSAPVEEVEVVEIPVSELELHLRAFPPIEPIYSAQGIEDLRKRQDEWLGKLRTLATCEPA